MSSPSDDEDAMSPILKSGIPRWWYHPHETPHLDVVRRVLDAKRAKAVIISCVVFFVTYCLWSATTSSRATSSSYGVSTQDSLPNLDSWPHIEVVRPAEGPIWPYRRFKSSPWQPPNITITHNVGGLAGGFLFLTIKSRGVHGSVKESAPYIMTDDNELVYAHNGSHGANNLRVQQFQGKPHLTVWLGESTVGHGYGEMVLLDENYQQVPSKTNMSFSDNIDWRLGPNVFPNGLVDFHEQEVTPRGSVYVTAYNNTPAVLTSIGGRQDAWLTDSLVYEIDIMTGEVLFTWSALEHLPIKASHLPIHSYQGNGKWEAPWDHVHINSIQDLGDKILISCRHSWAVYLISKKTGEVIWELSGSGEGGSFGPLPEYGQFRWQHFAHAHNITKRSMEISIYDNHNMMDDNGTTPSRGLLLEVGLPPNPTVPPAVLRNIQTNHSYFANSQGSYEPSLPNGNQLLCHGPVPVVQEYGPAVNGTDLRWEGRFGRDETAQSYRAYKGEWHALPTDWDPSLVLEMAEDAEEDENFTETVEAHVSWNGATDIDSWTVYSGSGKKGPWTAIGSARKAGFETVFKLEMVPGGCIQLGAVQHGLEVRRSNPSCIL